MNATRFKFNKFSVLFVVSLLPQISNADLVTPSDYIKSLNLQIALIKKIEQEVEIIDLPEIYALHANTQNALNALMSVGALNSETILTIQTLVINQRFSEDYFKRIQTDSSLPYLFRFKALAAELAKSTALDKSIFSRITATVFSQIKEKLDHLPNESALNSEQRFILKSLIIPLGITVGTAKQGDNLKTLLLGRETARKIDVALGKLNSLTSNDAAFESITTIYGLNEYYKHAIRSQSEEK